MEPQEFAELPPLKDPEFPPTYSGGFLKDLLLLVLLTILSGVVVYAIGGVYLNYYYGSKAVEKGIPFLLEHYKNDLNGLRLFQILNTVGLFLIPAWIYILVCRSKPVAYLSLDIRPPTRDAWMLPGIVLSFFPMLAIMYFFNQQLVLPPFLSGLEDKIQEMEEQSELFIKAMLETKQVTLLIANMLLVAVLPAICEEIFFRGTVMKILYGKTRDIHLAIIFSAFLFSFFHFQFYGFLPRMALGMLFGYLYWWSGSLWTPVIAHLINNAWQVYAAYLYYNGTSEINMDDVDMFPLSTTAMSTAGFFLLCYLYFNASRLQQFLQNNDSKLGKN